MTSLMPSGTVETFTGTDGSTPNTTNITLARNEGTGGSISIQGNRLRIRTGNAHGNRTSIRITGLIVADCEAVFDWDVATTQYPAVVLRADSPASTVVGYTFSLMPTDMLLTRHVSASSITDLVTFTHGFTAGAQVRTRVALFGQRLRARTWLRTNSEPTSVWDIDTTDTGGVTAAGYVGWTTQSSGAASGSQDFFVDNIQVTDTLTPTQATLLATGSITPTKTLTKTMIRKFVGTITPAGVVARARVVVKIITGSITPAGAFAKIPAKALGGLLTPAGAFAKTATKKFTGAITPAATISRSIVKKFTGAITPAGAFASMFLGRVFGEPGTAVLRLVQDSIVRIRYRKG